MDNYYAIHLTRRKVSFVVLLIDTYTQKPPSKKRVDAFVRGYGQNVIGKEDGSIVFVNMPDEKFEIDILSDEYFTETITVDMKDGNRTTGTNIVKVRLIPNAEYKLSRGTTFLDCTCAPGTEIHVFPIGCESSFRVAKQMENSIAIRTISDTDLSDRLFAFYDGVGPYIFEIGEKIVRNTYMAKLEKQYERSAEIYEVSIGKADENGRLLCPIRGFSESCREVFIIINRGEHSSHMKCDIVYGKGNAIIL